MPVYKNNAQNRKLGRVGKSWGKAKPKPPPLPPAKKGSIRYKKEQKVKKKNWKKTPYSKLTGEDKRKKGQAIYDSLFTASQLSAGVDKRVDGLWANKSADQMERIEASFKTLKPKSFLKAKGTTKTASKSWENKHGVVDESDAQDYWEGWALGGGDTIQEENIMKLREAKIPDLDKGRKLIGREASLVKALEEGKLSWGEVGNFKDGWKPFITKNLRSLGF